MTTAGNGVRRAAALACLLALSFGPTQFLPEALAFVAGMEGSHTVLVGSGPDGKTEIVLRHAQGDDPEASRFSVPHRHGLASKVICLLSNPPLAEGDHVATFTPGGAIESAQKCRRVQPRFTDAQPLTLDPVTALAWRSPFEPCAFGSYSNCSRVNVHSVSARQRCLRSTCLLL